MLIIVVIKHCVMNVPVLNINQAGFGLIVCIIVRAFYNIATAPNGNNRARTTLLACFTINRFRNIYIALHIIKYVVLYPPVGVYKK